MKKVHTMDFESGKITTEYIDFDKLADEITNDDRVGMFLAETFQRYANDYVPMDTGMLSQNYITEPFKVTYTQPYAYKMYRGVGFNFKKHMHPNATALWDLATMQAHGEQISKELQAYINSL